MLKSDGCHHKFSLTAPKKPTTKNAFHPNTHAHTHTHTLSLTHSLSLSHTQSQHATQYTMASNLTVFDKVDRKPESGKTTVTVHPIVLLSVVDHYNRACRGTKNRAVGVLLGSWKDNDTLDVSNSFAGVCSSGVHKRPSSLFLPIIFLPRPCIASADQRCHHCVQFELLASWLSPLVVNSPL